MLSERIKELVDETVRSAIAKYQDEALQLEQSVTSGDTSLSYDEVSSRVHRVEELDKMVRELEQRKSELQWWESWRRLFEMLDPNDGQRCRVFTDDEEDNDYL